MKTLHLAIISVTGMVLVVSSINMTFAQNVTNSSNPIPPIPSSILDSPVPTLTPSENQSVVKVALSIPELQNWSHDWKYVDTGFLGNNKLGIAGGFEWQYAMVYLKTPPNSGLIPCDIGWDAEVTVDMTTMKVVSSDYPTMNSQCHGVTITGGGPQNVQLPPSPLKQFKSGVITQNIACKEGFVIAIKKQGHQPACVDPDTVSKLVLRGWSENPLNGLLLKYGNQTEANLVFYDIMNEPKIRDWSVEGWRYSDYSYASNGETGQSSATIHLYLPSKIGKHECENGSYGFVVVNLKPIEIEHNYTEAGCEIVTTTATSVDPESNGR